MDNGWIMEDVCTQQLTYCQSNNYCIYHPDYITITSSFASLCLYKLEHIWMFVDTRLNINFTFCDEAKLTYTNF